MVAGDLRADALGGRSHGRDERRLEPPRRIDAVANATGSPGGHHFRRARSRARSISSPAGRSARAPTVMEAFCSSFSATQAESSAEAKTITAASAAHVRCGAVCPLPGGCSSAPHQRSWIARWAPPPSGPPNGEPVATVAHPNTLTPTREVRKESPTRRPAIRTRAHRSGSVRDSQDRLPSTSTRRRSSIGKSVRCAPVTWRCPGSAL